jgi:hypothetical protein
MKEWRKLVWSLHRAFVSLRKSDMMFAKLKIDGDYEYSITPENKKMIIKFRKRS